MLWNFLAIIMFILVICLLVLIFFVFGAGYEFVKCYRNSKIKKSDGSHTQESHGNDSYEENESDLRNTSINSQTKLFSNWKDILIVILLILIGLLVQPFFLMFKALEMMMECYRNYGCLVFWFLWSGNNN